MNMRYFFLNVKYTKYIPKEFESLYVIRSVRCHWDIFCNNTYLFNGKPRLIYLTKNHTKCCKLINYCVGDAKTKLFLSGNTSTSKYVLSTNVYEMIDVEKLH